MIPPNSSVEHEPVWPGAIALVAAFALNLLLPHSLSASPGWLPVALVAALAIAALRSHHWHRWLGHLTAGLVTAGLIYSLARLIIDLTLHRGVPVDLLRAALVLWSMNIFVFASWYWRLDLGGPHARSHRRAYCGGAFLFPQLTIPPELRQVAHANGWRPRFIDYLFLAFNTSTAFSPTDVPVLSAWAKVLMMIQSSISLATLAMVAARAVNIL